MLKKILTIILLILILCNNNMAFAANEWYSSARTFFNTSYGYTTSTTDLESLSDAISLIKTIGNAIFIVVTIILGIKYMLGSSEGKADLKEGLTGLVIAIVLFYGWTALDEILRNSLNYFFGTSGTAEIATRRIYGLALYILNFASVGVVIYVGIKYLLSGAEGKSDLKGRGVPFVIGLVMTFATIRFLKFVIEVLDDFI